MIALRCDSMGSRDKTKKHEVISLVNNKEK